MQHSTHGIIVFGANGSGKTTLGRELARILGFKHMDHETYAFAESEIPYTNERSHDEKIKLMLADIYKSHGFVLSSVTGDFGKEIESLYDFAVYIEAPLELRIDRVAQRNIERFGDRAREGGDMYEQQQKFVEFVASRPLSRIERWAETLSCPVVRVDGTIDWRANAKYMAERYYEINRP
ncbi:MAG: AAA family ATPase [Oscillospiraceae bacterium]|jgi:cytidylate kinase|nr:AAA family ATPase [Oscillospiraceae bacterium]